MDSTVEYVDNDTFSICLLVDLMLINMPGRGGGGRFVSRFCLYLFPSNGHLLQWWWSGLHLLHHLCNNIYGQQSRESSSSVSFNHDGQVKEERNLQFIVVTILQQNCNHSSTVITLPCMVMLCVIAKELLRSWADTEMSRSIDHHQSRKRRRDIWHSTFLSSNQTPKESGLCCQCKSWIIKYTE